MFLGRFQCKTVAARTLFITRAWFPNTYTREAGNKGNYMRKILIALPCLLISGLVAAKEAPALNTRQGADSVLMATAFDASNTKEQPLIQMGGAHQLEAAQRKSTSKAKAPAAPKPVAAAPTDNSKRFLMTQNGKQMTADDFDAWMKKNGYRVATGAPAAGAPAKAKEEEPAKQGSK